MTIYAFRPIPGYDGWCVTKDGRVFDSVTGKKIRRHMYGDRLFVSYKTEVTDRLLSIHRAVALAWVENDDPDLKTVVNHKDGNPLNNWYENLEWTTTSGNNYHAVNTGLRNDNMPCKIRDFHTKEIREFPSIAQACDFMRIPNTTHLERLRPWKFGKLIAGRYEFRLMDDPEPFFYEDRPYIISPSRFMLEVTNEDGSKRYVFNIQSLLQHYQLYRCPNGKSFPALVEYARQKYPGKTFVMRDGYAEGEQRERRRGAKKNTSFRMLEVVAKKDEQSLKFKSLTEAAAHFKVDRSTIKLRLENPEIDFLGWSFEGKPVYIPLKKALEASGEKAAEADTCNSTKPSSDK